MGRAGGASAIYRAPLLTQDHPRLGKRPWPIPFFTGSASISVYSLLGSLLVPALGLLSSAFPALLAAAIALGCRRRAFQRFYAIVEWLAVRIPLGGESG